MLPNYFLDMGISIVKIGLLIIATQFLLSSGCNKNETKPCVSGGYSFAVTSEWSPQREIYTVGDTIYLTSNFPKFLADQINTSIIVDYSNSTGIGGAAKFYELDTILHTVVGATSKLDFISFIGTVGNEVLIPSEAKSVLYSELSSLYSLKIAVVLKQRGIVNFPIFSATQK